MTGLSGNIPWRRFWIPRETAPALLGGYLADPEGEYGKIINPLAKTLDQLDDKPCVALLGEPGVGKSYVVEAYRDDLRARHGFEAVLHVDFRWQSDLEDEIFKTAAFAQCLAGQLSLTLILDGLDEHPKGAYYVASQLISKLPRGPLPSLRLRIACRSAEWPTVLDEQLPRIWKSSVENELVAFYALAPLREADVAMAAGDKARDFLDEVARVNAEPLASKPITLDFLLAQYRQAEKLPRERVKLYEEGCWRLCDETSRSRGDLGRTGALRVDQRLAIASRIAAVSILCRRSLITWGANRGAPSAEAVRVDELVGGVEPTPHGDVAVTPAAVKEVLEVSGLFRPRGAGWVGWDHQTYAEFLAALFLHRRGLSTEQLVREVSNFSVGGTVPALRETIAWLASMDDAFFRKFVTVDPGLLLGSDFAMVGPVEREALVDALLGQINDRKTRATSILWNRKAQALLAHPRLADQLLPYITGRSYYVMARRAAIQIAGACRVQTLQEQLVELALDASEGEYIRSDAAQAIVRVGSREAKRRLKPLVLGEHGPDPDDELKGLALQAVWPDDISAADLFANLTPPKNESRGGSYSAFLDSLKENLTPAILPEALRWTMGLPPRHDHRLSFSFADLLDETLKVGWENLQNPKVCIAFAEAARHRLMIYDDIFEVRNGREGRIAELEQDDYKRRLLVRALLTLPPWGHDDEFHCVDKGIVLPRDVPWAIEQLRAEPSPSQRTRWATVLGWFRMQWTFDVANPIIGALPELEELRRVLHGLPLLVDLGSPESRWMRRGQRQGLKESAKLKRMFRSRTRPRKRVKANRNIRNCLLRFSQGEVDAGSKLHYWMMLDSKGNSHHHTSGWDLTKYPGWQRADDDTKARVLDVGRAYLLRTGEHADQWPDRNNLDDPAAAAYAYLCLIDKLDPEWLDSYGDAVWMRWASIPLIISLFRDYQQNRRLVARAYRANPSRVLDELRVQLDQEHEEHDTPRKLGRMADCWDDALVCSLLQFVQRSDLKPRFLGQLLDEMIAHGSAGAVTYAASLLAVPVPTEGTARLRMHAAAHALMAYAPEVGWSSMRPLLRSDPEFGREVFRTFPRDVDIQRWRTWGNGLSTSEAADLYMWMGEHFQGYADADNPSRSHGQRTLDVVQELRNTLLNELVSRGTPEAVAALERMQQIFTQRDWTWEILAAKEAAAQGTWTPRSPREIIELRPVPAPLPATTMSLKPLPLAVSAASDAPPLASPVAAPGVDFPPPLLDAYRQGRLAVLVGSGLSLAKDVKGNFPTWDALPERLLDQVAKLGLWSSARVSAKRDFLKSGHLPLESMLSELDTLKTALQGACKYQAALNAAFRPQVIAPGDVHRALVDLGVGVLATTNYDLLLEDAEGAPRRTRYTWKESDNALSDIDAGRNVLFKIHGTAEHDDTVVMTQSEYANAATDISYQRVMSLLLQKYTFLLVGYGINDPLDLDLVFKLNVKAFGPASQRHYALVKDARGTDRDRWGREFNVQVVPYQNHDDLPAILRALRALRLVEP